MYTTSRRHFLKNAAILSPALLTFLPSYLRAGSGSGLRIGFIGVGSWGRQYLSQALQHSKLDIRAICDTDAGSVKEALKLFSKAGCDRPDVADSYSTLLSRADIDAVIIGAPWQLHYEIAKAALLAGKHVGCGPVMGTTLEEHQDIVRISEKTGRHYVMLDEHSYRGDLLAVTNMVKEGVFGELESIRAGARPDTLAAEQKGDHPYPVFPATLTSALLGTEKGNGYVSLRVVEEQQQYVINKPHPEKGHARLVFTTGKVRNIELTTQKGQTVSLQMDTAMDQPISTGFHITGNRASWFDLTGSIWLKESATQQNNIWDAAQPYLDNHAAKNDLRAFKQVDKDNACALAINDFVNAIQQPAGSNKPVYAAATNSMIGTLAALSAAEGGATIKFPDFI